MADYSTEIRFTGSKDDYSKLLKILRFYTEERLKQYEEHGDCWYLDGLDDTDYSGDGIVKKTLLLSGPYGVMNGPLSSEVNIFEKISEIIPESNFVGAISGWDSGAAQSIRAELKDGMLYLKYSCDEFDSSDWNEIFSAEEETEPVEENTEKYDADYWDETYNPQTHTYLSVCKADYRKVFTENEWSLFNSIMSRRGLDASRSRVLEIIKDKVSSGSKAPIRYLFLNHTQGDEYAVKYLNDSDEDGISKYILFMCERSYCEDRPFSNKVEELLDCIYEYYTIDKPQSSDAIIEWGIQEIDESKARIVSCDFKVPNEETIDLVIPEEINGYTVTEIEPYVLSLSRVDKKDYLKRDGLSKIVSIAYPKGIRNITDTGSFTIKTASFAGKPYSIGCISSSLERIDIPDSVKTIKEYAFHKNNSMKSIIFPKGLKRIGEEAFYYSGFKEIIIPERVVTIGYEAFAYMEQLERVVILAQSVSIKSYAFNGCKKLMEVVIESDEIKLEDGVFNQCPWKMKIICTNREVADHVRLTMPRNVVCDND